MRLVMAAALGGVLAACALTTDLDGFAQRAASTPDARSDAPAPIPTTGDATMGAPDAALAPDVEASAPVTYGDLVRADAPLVYFPLDEAAGARFAVEQVSRRAGQVEGDVQFGAPGVAGTGVRIDGFGALDFGDVLDLQASAWSFEVWVHPVFTSDEFYEYVNKRIDPGNGLVVYLRKKERTTAQLEQHWPGGGRGVNIELPAPDHFIHIVFTYEPGVGPRAWADGKASDIGYDAVGGPADNTVPLRLLGGVKGHIDELAVYDHALSDARILAHYAAGRKP